MGEVLGIDVSHYQLDIDWKKVAAAGKRFAILKCMYEAQSHRKDEYFEFNYNYAGKFGLSRGVYIFIASASIKDPKGDANALLGHLKNRPLEYGIWLDFESDVLARQGKTKIEELAYIYANIFRSAGYYTGIYCNKYWYDTYISEKLKRDFKFWVARYPRNDTGTYDPTSSLKPSKSDAVAWQYSSKGRVDGINTNVDLDVDYDGIIKLFGSEGKITYKPITPALILEIVNGEWGNGSFRKAKLTASGYNYEEVRAKINELDKIGKAIIPELKDKAGEYWKSVARLMTL